MRIQNIEINRKKLLVYSLKFIQIYLRYFKNNKLCRMCV